MAININEFNDNLNRAITWTNNLSKDFDYENGFYGLVFRQTNPIIKGEPLYKTDSDYATWNVDDLNLSNYVEALNQVLIRREGMPLVSFGDLSELGRILIFEIGLTTNDGIMIAESHCFIDESDVPPIDTWFYIEPQPHVNIKALLYCWIPKPFEPVVEQAMKCEIMECLAWLKYFD